MTKGFLEQPSEGLADTVADIREKVVETLVSVERPGMVASQGSGAASASSA